MKESERFVSTFEDAPASEVNGALRRFVIEDVSRTWSELWELWPLRFVVYHDFLLRYPDSQQASRAKERLIELTKGELARAKEWGSERTDLVLRGLYGFLLERYATSLSPRERREAESLLRGQ